VVLAWLLARSRPGIIPIPGASTVAQLDEILSATSLSLEDEVIRRLDEAGSAAMVSAG
jgi:aryl-alcohol dehydrogenase-like predicted oxidoreductase